MRGVCVCHFVYKIRYWLMCLRESFGKSIPLHFLRTLIWIFFSYENYFIHIKIPYNNEISILMETM